MITMYRNGEEMEVNSNPDGVKILEANGWSTDKPKKAKKEKVEDDD